MDAPSTNEILAQVPRKLGFFLAALCLLWPPLALAQKKTIIIDEDLRANSAPMEVRVKQRFLKTALISFGDYAVTGAKSGIHKEKEHSNLLGTHTKTSRSSRDTLALKGPGSDWAHVVILNTSGTEASRSIEVTSWLSLGDDAVLEDIQVLSATITVNEEKTPAWRLLRKSGTSRLKEENNDWEFFLTDGVRKLIWTSVTSRKSDDDPDRNPALGFELSEEGRALAAVQVKTTSPFPKTHGEQFVFIRQDLEPRMKLVLAAAIATILYNVEYDVDYDIDFEQD